MCRVASPRGHVATAVRNTQSRCMLPEHARHCQGDKPRHHSFPSSMKVELFALCDYAADYGGKLTVVGIFDSIFAKQLPAVHALCCVAVKLRFEKIEEGEKRVRLSISDDDGKPVLQP